jgi:hypothetical protein
MGETPIELILLAALSARGGEASCAVALVNALVA